MSGNLGELNFDAQAVEPNAFDVLPAGEYQVAIVGSVVEGTKAGTGKFLALELQVLDGPFRGRKLFDRLNIWNPSAKAVEIAKGTLSAICRAVGVLTPGDSSQLHDKPLSVKVVVTRDVQYGDKNEIKAYRKVGEVAANQASVAAGMASPRAAGPPPNDEIPF